MNQKPRSRLQQKATQSVAKIDTAIDLDRSKVDWDDLRVFAAVAAAGSLRGGADLLGIQTSTVSRRIKILEAALGAQVMLRSPDGVHLTQVGSRVRGMAEEISQSVATIEREAQSLGPYMFGRVRLSLTEGLGAFWVVPRLVEFQRANPQLVIDAKLSQEISDSLGVETDLAIQLERPKNVDLVAVRLGTLHVSLFVSARYRDRFGIPKSAEELRHHKFVSQAANQIEENLFLEKVGIYRPEGVVSFRTNSAVSHFAMIKKGAGIGALATYAACLDPSLIAVEMPEMKHRRDFWLVFHPEVKGVPRVARTIEFIQSCFDKQKFPWFGDEYIPPSELTKLKNEDWKINMLDYV